MLQKYRVDENKEFFKCKLPLIQKTFNDINSLFEIHSVEKLYAMYKCNKQLYSRKCECDKILCSRTGYNNHIKTCKVKPYIDEINNVKNIVSDIAETEKTMLDLCEELILESIVTRKFHKTGNHVCECTRSFDSRQGLFRHRQKCDMTVQIDIKKLKELLKQKYSVNYSQQINKNSEVENSKTNDKKPITQHLEHNMIEIDLNEFEDENINSAHICNCGKHLNSRQALHAHKKVCNGIDVKSLQIKKLNIDMNETKKTLNTMQQVIDHMKSVQNK